MIKEIPQKVFTYQKDNSSGEPITLSFRFTVDDKYRENIEIFISLLKEARQEILQEVPKDE